jgi:hypothetical protein
MNNPEVDIFEKYKKEIELDIALDEINIKEVQMRLPAIKHKWVARLIQAKSDLKKLQSIRRLAVERLRGQAAPPIQLPNKLKDEAATKQSAIVKIDKQISQLETIIEYLTKVEVITRSMTYDIRNLADIIKLESS